MFSQILLLLASAAPGEPGTLPNGVVRGVVLHAGDQKPVAGAEAGLRVRLEGRFVLIAETTTDAQGRFTFRQLPVGEDFEYLPGANRDGVHYPGPRVHLTRGHPAADVRLTVCDAVRSPSPLVARRHEILICPEPGLVKVSETILIDNPSPSSFVGQAADGMSQPITLRLSIPSDFQRTTFDQEFFGRHFSLVDGKLVTSIPWTPGPRELKFTYVLANPKSRFHWDRPLDLPCSDLTLIIRTARPDEVFLQPGCKTPPAQGRGHLRLERPQSVGGTSDSRRPRSFTHAADGVWPLAGPGRADRPGRRYRPDARSAAADKLVVPALAGFIRGVMQAAQSAQSKPEA